ncbi:DciA family protein [Streptomyces sp. NPDC060366]|uniref:DciA family protein n=1 Tax=Streptomyces sp. NPDC060366 TaxID=3347105 RepID=UPI00364C336C
MSDQPHMQPASGRDLARQALAQYKATAKHNPGAPARKKPRRTRTDRTNGRDPVGFGAVLAGLNVDYEWGVALDGGSILDRWATICPEVFRDTTQPVAFDAGRGRLDLRPGSYPAATQLRLLGGQLAAELNKKLGRGVVRSIRVLPVGAITAPDAPQDVQEPPQETGPVITRDTASPGYQRTLQAHREHRGDPDRPANPYVAAAVDRQNQALRDRREPETAFTDAVAAADHLAEKQPADSLEASLQAARARAAADRAGREPVRLFGAA